VNARGSRGAARRLAALRAHVERAFPHAAWDPTTKAGDAVAIARAAAEGGADLVVAVGGDGTVNEVVNGLLTASSTPPAIGILPAGSGSDLARTLRLPRDPAGAVNLLARGHRRRIDVGEIECEALDPRAPSSRAHRYFVNMAGCGASGRVVEWFNRLRLAGAAGYGVAAALTAVGYKWPLVEVAFNAAPPREVSLNLLFVCNGEYCGGGMRVGKGARPDDGLLTVVEAGGVSRLGAMLQWPQLYLGGLHGVRGVRVQEAREVRVKGPRSVWSIATASCAAGFPPPTASSPARWRCACLARTASGRGQGIGSPRNWTITSRCRELVSSSTRTTCCQVPRASRPATTGIVTEGPSRAARTWLEPLSSPQRRWCAYSPCRGAMRSNAPLRSAIAPGSHSIVVTPAVEPTTKIVTMPEPSLSVSSARETRGVRSRTSPCPLVSIVSRWVATIRGRPPSQASGFADHHTNPFLPSNGRRCIMQPVSRPAARTRDMKIEDVPFGVTDWAEVPRTEHRGETGTAWWRTREQGNIRVRMVEYSAGYLADHWCSRGHVLLVLEGELVTELQDGSVHVLKAGQSYQVADTVAPHRSRTAGGARLFIVD
jgi:diacylglycerol kinase family enzyme